MTDNTEITDRKSIAASRNPDDIDRLLNAGWIVREDNEFRMTDKGEAALRRGFVGGVPGEQGLPIDSVRAQSKPAIRKKAKRHQ